MERFAKIKSGTPRRKLNVLNICRSCGLENDDKYPILGQNPFSDDSVLFSEKVFKLTGIRVSAGDQMPANMCIMCMDKINDFFEFRLMAENTEAQTRDALGLPPAPPAGTPAPRIIIRQKIVEVKPLSVPLIDIKYSVQDQMLINKAFGVDTVKSENIPSGSKKRAEKTSATQPPTKKPKKELSCNICADSHFSYPADLNDHLMKDHIPTVAKYACGSCQETFEQFADYKNHENKHSKEKLPYTCFICGYSYGKLKDFSKHMTNYTCKHKEKLAITVEDIKCFQCKKKFLTQNLFEWHACFLKTRGTCNKCGQYFQKKSALFKHYIHCEGQFQTPDAALDPTLRFKMENAGFRAPVKVSTVAQPPPAKKTKGPKKKTVPKRKEAAAAASSDIVKAELQLDAPPEDDEYANYEEDITYDNFGNDSDTDDGHEPLEPHVMLHEQPVLQIKLERLSDPPAIRNTSENTSEPENPPEQPNTAEVIRNIKKEKSASQAMNVVSPVKNTLALKIKSERGNTGQSVVQVLNPMAVGAIQPVKKKVFKMPQQLAMKIKMERKDAGYGDDMQERDEAEPEDEDLMPSAPPSPVVNIKEEKLDMGYEDSHKVVIESQDSVAERDEAEPEDEDLLCEEQDPSLPVEETEPETPLPVVNVKKEKMDEGYGDTRAPPVKTKQLINPMALIMREKPTVNGFQEKSLVISAVTSINSESPEEGMEQSREGSQNMVQIPNEFLENQEKESENHENPTGSDDTETENHDMLTGSNDIKARNHDKPIRSDGIETGSHDNITESNEIQTGSHGKPTGSRSKPTENHEKPTGSNTTETRDINTKTGNNNTKTGNNYKPTGSDDKETRSNDSKTENHKKATDEPSDDIETGSNDKETGRNDTETGSNDTETGSNDTETGSNDTNTVNNEKSTGSNDVNSGNHDKSTGSDDTETGNQEPDAGTQESIIENSNTQDVPDSEKTQEPTENNDDLDALLKIYEDSTEPDNNDLLQELLKFD